MHTFSSNTVKTRRFKRILRASHACVALVIPTLAALTAGFGVWLVTLNKRTALNWMGRFLGRFGLMVAGIKVKISHQERIDQHRPAVFIFNHRSGLDPILICRVVQTNVIGIAKKELRNNPVLGPLLRFGDTLFVDRNTTSDNRNDLSAAFIAMESGLSIAIAPEGTRQHQQTTGPFKSGAFRIAQATGRPIVPIYIQDSDQCLPPRSSQLQTGTIHIDVLEPIFPHEYASLSAEELAELARQRYLERARKECSNGT